MPGTPARAEPVPDAPAPPRADEAGRRWLRRAWASLAALAFVLVAVALGARLGARALADATELSRALREVRARAQAADRVLADLPTLKEEVAHLRRERAAYADRLAGAEAAPRIASSFEVACRNAGLRPGALEEALPRVEGPLVLHPITLRFHGDAGHVPAAVDALLRSLAAPGAPLARISGLELDLPSFAADVADGWLLVEVAGAAAPPRPDGATLGPYLPPPLPTAASRSGWVTAGLARRLREERARLLARADALVDLEELLRRRDALMAERQAVEAWIAGADADAEAVRRAAATTVVRLGASAMGRAGFRRRGATLEVYDDD